MPACAATMRGIFIMTLKRVVGNVFNLRYKDFRRRHVDDGFYIRQRNPRMLSARTLCLRIFIYMRWKRKRRKKSEGELKDINYSLCIERISAAILWANSAMQYRRKTRELPYIPLFFTVLCTHLIPIIH